MLSRFLVNAFLAVVCVLSRSSRPVPEFHINLDVLPEQRYVNVIQHFNASLWDFYDGLKPHFLVNEFAKQLSRYRGPEDEEFQREIEGIAELSRIPQEDIHTVQMLYELNTLMVPIVNISWPWDLHIDTQQNASAPMQQSPLDWLPQVGCTGIVAKDSHDGTVYHARNLDFSFAKHLQPLVYVAVFTKNGGELFRTQTLAGYPQVLTGMRPGEDGYTIEINTRYLDHSGGNKEMLRNLFSEKRTLSGWSKRKILENIASYDLAVQAFSFTPYVATEYNIISGVKKGTVLARDPDGLAYQLPLNESGKGYVIMTNFDYIWHDIREHFDPTSAAGFGVSRRKAAQRILNRADVITPEVLTFVMNDRAVIAIDTIFQAFMNVETGLWNVSLPACKECGLGPSELLV